MRHFLLGSIFVILIATQPAIAGLPRCADVSMTISAAPQIGGPFDGLYKYTITGSWDTGAMGLSHIDFLLDLADCPCICDPGVIIFDNPAGTADGEPAPCTVLYEGSFFCDVDSGTGVAGPGVKFDEAPDQSCGSGQTGTGTWCFYSTLSPVGSPTDVHTDAVVIKFGTSACTGDLTGTRPGCVDCPTPVEPQSWGGVKALYN